MKKFYVLLLLFSTFGNLFCQSEPKYDVLSENFDSQVFPPNGWNIVSENAENTWTQGNADINFSTMDENNVFSAVVFSVDEHQDERIVSPAVNIPQNAIMSFYAMFNWQLLGNNNITFEISNNNGATWDVMWNAQNTPQFQGYQWKHRYVDLMAYAGQNVMFSWHVQGSEGSNFAIDGIQVSVSLDNDIAIEPTFPFGGVFNFVQIPASQIDALNAKLQEHFDNITPELSFYQCRIVNNGNNTATNAQLTVKVNDDVIGTTEGINIDPGTSSQIVGIPSLLELNMGTNEIKYEITSDSSDQFAGDNVYHAYPIVTEHIYAMDSTNDFESGLTQFDNVSNMFSIASNQTVINGMQIAFAQGTDTSEVFKISLYFYKTAENIFNDTEPEVGLPFFTYYLKKSDFMVGGFGEIRFPKIRFPQFGTYLLFVETVGDDDLNICSDNGNALLYHLDAKGDVITTTGDGAAGCRILVGDIPTTTCNVQLSNLRSIYDCDDDEVTFAWNGEAEGYLLHLSYGEGNNAMSFDYVTNDNYLVLEDLPNDEHYTWSVTPYNEEGVTGTMFAGEDFYKTGYFEQPSELQSDVTDNNDVCLSWVKPNQQGVTGYDIYRGGQLLTHIEGGDITEYCEYDVPVGEYTYGVAAVYYHGNCESPAVEVYVKITDGIGEIRQNTFLDIYPNPADDHLTIKGESISKIVIYNMLGDVVYQQESSGADADVDVSALGEGLYFVKVTHNGGIYVNKLIINH